MQSSAEPKNSKVLSEDNEVHRPDSGRTCYWLCAAAISSIVATYVYCSGPITVINYSGVKEQLLREVPHGKFRNISIKEESESVCTACSHFHEIGILDSSQTLVFENIEEQVDEVFPIVEGTCSVADTLD